MIKKSKDIFGNEIIDITEGNGQSKTIKTSTDIFGDVTESIVDQNGRLLLSSKKSKDIFGNLITTITTKEEATSVRFLLRLLQDRGSDDMFLYPIVHSKK